MLAIDPRFLGYGNPFFSVQAASVKVGVRLGSTEAGGGVAARRGHSGDCGRRWFPGRCPGGRAPPLWCRHRVVSSRPAPARFFKR